LISTKLCSSVLSSSPSCIVLSLSIVGKQYTIPKSSLNNSFLKCLD
jgi:hypothetical protein